MHGSAIIANKRCGPLRNRGKLLEWHQSCHADWAAFCRFMNSSCQRLFFPAATDEDRTAIVIRKTVGECGKPLGRPSLEPIPGARLNDDDRSISTDTESV